MNLISGPGEQHHNPCSAPRDCKPFLLRSSKLRNGERRDREGTDDTGERTSAQLQNSGEQICVQHRRGGGEPAGRCRGQDFRCCPPEELKHGKSNLLWALQNLARDASRSRIVIAHVHVPAQMITSKYLNQERRPFSARK